MRLVACMIVGFLPAFVGAFVRVGPWYPRPWFHPPDWLFGFAWTILYATCGVALWLVVKQGWNAPGVKHAVAAFAVQHALNAAWTPVFFGLRSAGAALVVIVLLWLAIAYAVARFWSVRDAAGAALLPYWAWVTFATALNVAIWRMTLA